MTEWIDGLGSKFAFLVVAFGGLGLFCLLVILAQWEKKE